MSTANVSRCFDVNFSTAPVSTFHTPCGKFLWRIQPPLKGEAAHSAGGVSGGTQNTNQKIQGEFVQTLAAPFGGGAPRSGKGGGVGGFEPSPFIEQHPLSQPCRFRSAVKSASSPIGEPRWLLRIRPSLYKNIGAYRETPQSAPLGLPAPLSGALFLGELTATS